MDVDDILLKNPDVIYRKDEDGGYLFDLNSGILQYINSSGVIIHELCDGTKSVGNIIELFLNNYPDEEKERLKDDAMYYINTLIAQKILKKIS